MVRLLIRSKTLKKKKRIHCQSLGKYRRDLDRRKHSSKHTSNMTMSYVRPVWVRRLTPEDRAYRYLRKV